MHPRPSSSRRAPTGAESSAPSSHRSAAHAPTSSLRSTVTGHVPSSRTHAPSAVRRTAVVSAAKPTSAASAGGAAARGDSHAASVASYPSPTHSSDPRSHSHRHHRPAAAAPSLSAAASASHRRRAAPQPTAGLVASAAGSGTSGLHRSGGAASGGDGYRVQRETHRDGVEREVIVLESDSDDDASGGANTSGKPALKRKKEDPGSRSGNLPARYDERAYFAHARADAQALAYGQYGVAGHAGQAGVKRKRKGAEGDEGPVSALGPPAPPEEPCDDKEGHFIVRTNVELNGRYRITKLLGQGTFGKVVQCVDMSKNRHVAVKIIRAVQKYRDASKVEIRVLRLLKERDPLNVNKCIHLLDCFDYRNHICIVSELLSTSVFDFLKDNGYAPFPQSQIQSFARQLLGSVAFLHDLRLVHTDLKPENILLVSNDAIKPKGQPPGQRRKVLKSSSIRLIDFGSATFEDDYHANVVSTRHYRAPEIILGLGWSYPCDAWSIGCILIEFFTGEALFQTHENLEHLAMMEAVFGRMPSLFAKQSARSKPEFFKMYKLDFPQQTTSKQSRKYVRAMKPLAEIVPASSVVLARFQDLLRKLLAWDPKDRITVREALSHPFFSVEIDDEAC